MPVGKPVHFSFSLSFPHFLLFLSESPLSSFIRDLASWRKCRPLLERIMTRAARWSFWGRRQGWTKSRLASEPPASARIMNNVPRQVRETVCVCVCVYCAEGWRNHAVHILGAVTPLCSGPGSYDLFRPGLAQLSFKQALLARTRKGGFGSTVQRNFIFHNKELLKGPGPAQYEVRVTTGAAFLPWSSLSCIQKCVCLFRQRGRRRKPTKNSTRRFSDQPRNVCRQWLK